jgi:2-polyprenyl-3-methyl-5-hydroxy-6-metoxy-1,4-benzoquinol methylase
MSNDPQAIVERNQAQWYSEEDTYTPARYARFLSHLGPEAVDVLDVGCNTGRGGGIMKSRLPGLRITGLDCVPDRLGKLDRAVYEQSVCAFSHDIPLATGSFDAIVAGEVIEHIAPPHVFPTLCEFFRLLRLGGRLILTTPNPEYLKNRLQGLSVLLDASHVSQHLPASLRRRLEDIGFSSIKAYGCGRVSNYLGPHFPLLSVYGSYLMVARKW